MSTSTFATHIVGGDLTYQHLGGTQYEITLNMYIDCINGTPGAISIENFANISYFDAVTNQFLSNDEVAVLTKKDVASVNYKCLRVEPNACVQQFSYKYTKTIDPGANGVVLAFQRCCRNYTVSNVINPDDVGATFFATIPPTSLAASNNSAVFKELPPNFLCTQAPLVFDHSATDADGDSLAYSLIVPYLGASPIANRPVPAGNPPYNNVPLSSGYNVYNMMNGSVKLQIDARTGILRVTPSDAGQYVVAVQVEEFRNGKLINTSFRDYQLNVIECELDVLANFDAPDETCDKKIDFINLSSGRSLRYMWDFGDENKTSDVSNSENTSWTYDSAGTYTVQLIVFNDGCADTFYKDLLIVPSRYVHSFFEATPTQGCDSLTVMLKNRSDSATSFQWNMGDGTIFPKNKEVTKYHYSNPGNYAITLSLTDSNTCNKTDDTSTTVEVLETKRHQVDFGLSYKKGCQADGLVKIVDLQNSSDQFIWERSEGNSWSDNSITSFRANTLGAHTLTLISTDTGLCVENDTATVAYEIDGLVPALDGITLYNVFSPGNDLYNQCFSIDVAKQECVQLKYSIFNRWGERIYEGTSINDCWNGKDYRSGKNAPAGEYFAVYIFTIEGRIENYELSNVISLIR